MITNLIIECIAEIQERYYSVTNPVVENANYSQQKTYPERNFVVAIRDLILRKYNLSSHLSIDMELYKQIAGRINEHPNIERHYNRYSFSIGIYPDLIIHAEQYDTNPENQLFSMECKTSPRLSSTEFEKDFFKLMLYKEVLNYHENLYLIVNNENEHVKNLLAQYREAGKYFSNNNVHIVNISGYGQKPVKIL